jgi:hypothetical protein
MGRLTDADRAILADMRLKPIGTPRTVQEKVAFEREWDERVEAALCGR